MELMTENPIPSPKKQPTKKKITNQAKTSKQKTNKNPSQPTKTHKNKKQGELQRMTKK